MDIARYRTQRTQPRFTVEVPADYADGAARLLQFAKGRKITQIFSLYAAMPDYYQSTELFHQLTAIAHMRGDNPQRNLLKEIFYLRFCEVGVHYYLQNGSRAEAERILTPLKRQIADLEKRLSKTI